MTHALGLALCVCAFAALAAATERVQVDLRGRASKAGLSRGMRLAGWGLLLASLAWLVDRQGWGLGLVSFSGHTSLAAGVVHLALIAHARRRAARGLQVLCRTSSS